MTQQANKGRNQGSESQRNMASRIRAIRHWRKRSLAILAAVLVLAPMAAVAAANYTFLFYQESGTNTIQSAGLSSGCATLASYSSLPVSGNVLEYCADTTGPLNVLAAGSYVAEFNATGTSVSVTALTLVNSQGACPTSGTPTGTAVTNLTPVTLSVASGLSYCVSYTTTTLGATWAFQILWEQ